MIKLIKIIVAAAVIFFCLNYWFEMNKPPELRWKKSFYQLEAPKSMPKVGDKKQLAAAIGAVFGLWFAIKTAFSPL